MFLRALCVFAMIVGSSTTAFAVGKTAVITLDFPHGAENCGMGEVGVSLAENISSVFWNPASLPAIGQNLSVQYLYSYFHEDLLPLMQIKDLYHNDTIHAFFMQDIWENIDFGASYSTNFISMGNTDHIDFLGNFIDSIHSSETVRSFALGLRFYDVASIGFTIKNFKSRLAPGFNGNSQDGIAQGQVFDLGFRLEKKFTIAELLDIQPAIGFMMQSFPQDSVRYIHSDTLQMADPLPLNRWYGASLKLNLLDLFGFIYAQEKQYSVIDQEFIDHNGYKIQITPFFALVNGSMDDISGNRFEENNGWVLTFNYQQTMNALVRCTDLFNPALSEKLKAPSRWAEKYHINPNIHFQYATSIIHTKGDNDVREDQERKDFSFGVSIIGDLSSLSLKNMHKDKNVKEAGNGTKSGPITESTSVFSNTQVVSVSGNSLQGTSVVPSTTSESVK